MFITYFLLALCSSIDAIGIGLTYGLRHIKIHLLAIVSIFLLSMLITMIALLFGNVLTAILPSNTISFIGSFLIMGLGLWLFWQSADSSKKSSSHSKYYQFMIKSLGITIRIIKDPVSSDFNHSNSIEGKEALYLGFSLSIDSFCIGIGSSMMGANIVVFPLLVSGLQVTCLLIGMLLGKLVGKKCCLPENIWNKIAGVVLITIGLLKSI